MTVLYEMKLECAGCQKPITDTHIRVFEENRKVHLFHSINTGDLCFPVWMRAEGDDDDRRLRKLRESGCI